MEILKSAAILVIGFVLLIKGADFFVEGSSSVAKKFNVPSLIIGMTIVAMGTSLPELAVSVTASITGNNTACDKSTFVCDCFLRIWIRSMIFFICPVLFQFFSKCKVKIDNDKY